jgi:hypothetical protein
MQPKYSLAIFAVVAVGSLAASSWLRTALNENSSPHPNDPVAALDPNAQPCTAKLISEIDASRIIGYGPLCRVTDNAHLGNDKLILEGIDVSIGKNVDDLSRDAAAKGASLEIDQHQAMIRIDRSVPPWRQRTVIRLKVTSGKVAGIHACQNHVSGDYQNRFNAAAVIAYGLPSYTASDGSSLTLKWARQITLILSGAPNFARLEVGEDALAGERDEGWRSGIFDELVALEDRGSMESARMTMSLAQSSCHNSKPVVSRMSFDSHRCHPHQLVTDRISSHTYRVHR